MFIVRYNGRLENACMLVAGVIGIALGVLFTSLPPTPPTC